jgi:hypothetical protein
VTEKIERRRCDQITHKKLASPPKVDPMPFGELNCVFFAAISSPAIGRGVLTPQEDTSRQRGVSTFVNNPWERSGRDESCY